MVNTRQVIVRFDMPQGDDKGLAVAEVLRDLANRIDATGIDPLDEEGHAVVDVIGQTIGWAKIESGMSPAYDEIINLIDAMERVYCDPYVEWESKYIRVFEEASWMRDKIEKSGLTMFDWYDPDTSYQEDVSSYMMAAMEFRNKIMRLRATEQ